MPQEDSLAGSLVPDAIGVPNALSRGHRWQGGRRRGTDPPVMATLRGRRDSLPPDPAGALAAVIAEALAHFDSGPGGARCPSRSAGRRPGSGRHADLPGTDSRRTPAGWRWSLNSCLANNA